MTNWSDIVGNPSNTNEEIVHEPDHYARWQIEPMT